MPQGYGQPVQNTRPNPYRLRQDLGYVPARLASGSSSSGGGTGGGGVIVTGGPSGPVITSSRVQVFVVAGATYTLTADDLYNYLIFTNAAGCVVTVPSDATALWSSAITGIQPVFALQQGTTAGPVTVVGAGGVTVNTLAIFQLKSYGPNAVLQLIETDVNIWTLFGAQAFL